RRDADKVLRERLATQYETQRDRLTQISQQAVSGGRLDDLDLLERASQQLQKLITRLRTAPRGYAGWFDSAQIQEGDLDQLYQFDATLASGVDKVKIALDNLATSVRTTEAVPSQVAALTDVLADLDARLDARQEFVSLGKRPAPSASPLGALQPKPRPGTEPTAYEQLKLGDAVSDGPTDYIVAGRITYSVASGKFYAYLLQDHEPNHWLRFSQNQELSITQEIAFTVPSPLPDTLTYSATTYTRAEEGAASVTVEGPTGAQPGAVNYARYTADGGGRLWVEDWGTETRVQAGKVVDPQEIRLYRKL
ncbi:MAG: DUF4178 domain-containing protein, partial [Rudaea sp.]